MNFDRIKELREQAGLSARKFAEILDIKYTTYYGYENGAREPGSETIAKLCGYFGCTADYLLGLTDSPHAYYRKNENSTALAETFTQEEVLHIKKYRALDEHGKDMVDTVLEKEYERIVRKDDEQEFQYAAARGNSRVKIPVQDDDDLPENDTIIDGL